jgi:hypothetical protein
MANSAGQKDPVYSDDDQRPVTAPDLRRQEGISNNTAGGNSWGASSSTAGRSGGATSSTGGRKAAEIDAANGHDGGFYNPSGEQASRLKEAEEAAGSSDSDDDEQETEGFYNDTGPRKKRGRFRYRRQVAIGGGLTGVIIGVILGGLSIVQGPLEFVHIAQLLERFHFSALQDTEDGRLTRIARYIHDPSKPQNTRLGIVGNSVADKLETKMKTAGFETSYTDKLGYRDGYTINRESDNFKGKDANTIKSELVAQYGLSENQIRLVDQPGGLKEIRIDTSDRFRDYFKNARLSRQILRNAGLSKLSAAVGARVLQERAGVTLHPIKKADQKILKGGAKAWEDLKKKFYKDEVTYTTKGANAVKPSSESAKDKDGNPVGGTDELSNELGGTAQDAANAAEGTANGDKNSLKAYKEKLQAKVSASKLAGGVGLVAVACIVQGLSKNVDNIRQEQIILPMMRMGMEAVSTGNQVMSNQDLSAVQLGFYKDFLDETDDNGEVVSTWNQAQSIQYELDRPQTGPDIPKGAQVFNKGNPYDFVNGIPGLGAVCSVLNSPFSFLLSGGPIGAVVSYLTGKEVIEPLLGDVASATAGTPVNPLASGAERGNYINYGARAAAGDQAASAGGVTLDSGQEANLKAASAVLDKSDLQSHNIAYRLFNLGDSQTLASRILYDDGLAHAPQNMASMVRSFGNIFSGAFRSIASLFTGVTHAATQPYDYHGLKAVGFTASDQDDPLFKNPFENACYVAGNCTLKNGTQITTGILDGPNGQTYIDRAKACFADEISKSGDVWDINAVTSSVSRQGSDYPDSDCRDDSTDWKRVRFWILDTMTVEGYDCSQGDTDTSDESCSDVGFASTGQADDSSTPSTQSGATIDMDNLFKDSRDVACADNTKDLGIQDGYTGGTKVKIRICAVSNLPSSGEESRGNYGVSGADGKAVVNSRVSGAVYAMVEAAKQDGVSLSANSAFRTMAHQQALCPCDGVTVARPGYSNHQMGLAIDFAGLSSNPSPGSGPIWNWLDKNASKFGYKNYPREQWHWSPTGN